MKNKSFYLRLVSLVVIVAALLVYNSITNTRLEAEEAVRSAEVQVAEQVTSTAGDSSASENTPEEGTTSVITTGWKDGTYDGEGTGFGGPIKVSVVVKDGKISSIGVLSHDREDDAYYNMAEAVIPRVIAINSTNVDVVSGATFSSNGILDAVDNALAKAVA